MGLGSAGGILLAGLAFGWLRSRHPSFGRFAVPAMWVFEVLGLHLFLAAVGISSGPAFVSGLAERGAGLLLAGVAVALVPHAVTLLAGQRLFPSLHPGVLLGACAGAGVNPRRHWRRWRKRPEARSRPWATTCPTRSAIRC